MDRVLITGGCGFIGSNYIHYLMQQESDIHIINLDALTYAGNLSNIESLTNHPRYEFVKADITDREAVRSVMQQSVTDVIHFAAESHVDRSIHDSGPFVRTNVLGTQILLDAAREQQVKRFIHVSTDEVYGSLGSTGYFTEETPLAPNSPYSASKAGSDLLVRSYHETFKLPTIITRCSNNYGPYQFPEKLIPLFVSNLMRDESVPVYGDGQNVRDWIHVSDHCRAIHRVWRDGRVGEVYNIGGQCEKTNLELTHTLLQIMDKPKSLIRYVQDRPGHDLRYAIDCTKMERELGWKPQISFEQGLRDTVEWYHTHTNWVETIRSGEYMRYYEQQYGSSVS